MIADVPKHIRMKEPHHDQETPSVGWRAVGIAAAFSSSWRSTAPRAAESFEVTHGDAEWRARLTPVQYAVLRQSDTECAFTSPLLHEARRGTFTCAGCDRDLFASTTKFDSGTG
jgi:peptide-methionine (R)-S-oxide reductase